MFLERIGNEQYPVLRIVPPLGMRQQRPARLIDGTRFLPVDVVLVFNLACVRAQTPIEKQAEQGRLRVPRLRSAGSNSIHKANAKVCQDCPGPQREAAEG